MSRKCAIAKDSSFSAKSAFGSNWFVVIVRFGSIRIAFISSLLDVSEWNCEPLLFDVDRVVGGVEMYLSDWVHGVFFCCFFLSVKTGSRCVGCVVVFKLYSWDFPRFC